MRRSGAISWRQRPRLDRGLLDDEGADGDDQVALLRDRDELAGVEEAPLGVVPAGERLHPDDPVGVELDLRLVVDLELACPHRRAEVGLELEPLLERVRISVAKNA